VSNSRTGLVQTKVFEASLSDLRKVRKGVIFVSHDRTLTALGGSKGFSKARNNGLLELQLEAKIDPITGDPMPALKGKLKYPGKVAIDVEIASWMKGAMNFSDVTATPSTSQASAQQQQLRAKLEELYLENAAESFPCSPENLQDAGKLSSAAENAETQQESEFPSSPEEAETFTFTDFQLGKAVFLAVKAEMGKGKKKSEIVIGVLECPGRKYRYGCAWFDALMVKFQGQ
jgi:hypothetical protein